MSEKRAACHDKSIVPWSLYVVIRALSYMEHTQQELSAETLVYLGAPPLSVHIILFVHPIFPSVKQS